MKKMELMRDRWAYLRRGLFRNVEPQVELAAVTQPVGRFKDLCTTESLSAFTSRVCWESRGGDIEKDITLNRNLIKRGHTTPLQAVEYVFYIDGTTKTLQAQWTRHKIGVGWVYRSTRYVPAEQNRFVYPAYDYIDDEEAVKSLLANDETHAKKAIEDYSLRKELGASKEDSRRIMPVMFNTTCFFFTNARALRNIFILRLDKAAEWEIRRLCQMMLNIVLETTPSLFEDFVQEGG